MKSVYRQTDGRTAGQTDMAKSTPLVTLISPIHTLWGLSRVLLDVTHGRTNAIYPGKRGMPGIKIVKKLWICMESEKAPKDPPMPYFREVPFIWSEQGEQSPPKHLCRIWFIYLNFFGVKSVYRRTDRQTDKQTDMSFPTPFQRCIQAF